MEIGTSVFQRISKENRKAAIQSITDALQQTIRFGTFSREYVEKCAENFFDATLEKVRKHETKIKKKTELLKKKD